VETGKLREPPHLSSGDNLILMNFRHLPKTSSGKDLSPGVRRIYVQRSLGTMFPDKL
jgi:hypothetical protein